MPLVALGVVLLPLGVELGSNDEAGHFVPGNEHQIGVCDFVANEVLLSGLGEVQVDDTHDTADFLAVALDGAGNLQKRVSAII